MKRASPFWLALFLLKYFVVLRGHNLIRLVDILLQLLSLYWQYELHLECGAFVLNAKICADFGVVFIFE